MTISVGGQSTSLDINSSNNTLSGIAAAINSASGNPGVTATIVNGTDGSHLVLRSTSTGAASTINVAITGLANDKGLSSLGVTSTPGSDVSKISSTGSTWTQTTAGQLGSAQSITSGAFASGSNPGTGAMTIAVGRSSMTLNVTASDTLNTIASAINASSSNPGLTASVKSDASGDHLVLTATNPGANNTINVTATGALSSLSVSSTTSTSTISSAGSIAWSQSNAGQDAQFTIDGTAVTSAANTVTSALSGVTLNLSAASVDPAAGTTSASPQTLTIAQDTTSQATAINNFVSLYNTLVTTMGTLTSFSSGSKTQGPLLGDSTLNLIQNTLASVVASGVKSGGTTSSLGAIGISLQADGTLSVDSTTLNSALQSNQATVAKLFNSTNGIAEQLNSDITGYLASSGPIQTRTNALNSDLTNISRQQTALSAYQAQLTSQYQAQFTALNRLMSTMNNNSQYLTQLFGGTNSQGALSANKG
ncbi:flagellar filament capping protein FliD [Burkholderia sp. BCC1993]|uniref:flagellar filament capping protein FliD n=1 Tax=Burkholderia sp. BCC1993 TaxID=2817444 RepID=UPI0039F05C28